MSQGDAWSARHARAAAGVVLAGLFLSAGVLIARLSPGLGERRHGIGVLSVDDLHEGQLEVAAAIVLAFIAAVVAGRVRRQPTRRHLLLLAAFSVLAFYYLVSALFTPGFDSLSANRFATWSTAWCGLLGSALLAAAVVLPDEPLSRRRHASARTLAACAGGVAACLLTAWLLRDQLPSAFDELPVTPEDLTYFSEHPSLLVVEVLACLCWAYAGAQLIAIAGRTQDDLTLWTGYGSLIAAVAFVNYSLFPSQFTELHYLGDFIFLAAVIVLLIGAVREVGHAEASLVDHAVYAERRRIAREMHDGVAQELAYISAQTQAIQRKPEHTNQGLSRITDAVERALDESRAAIKELSGPVDESLAHAIEVAAVVVAGRTGAELELAMDEHLVVSPPVRVALVRITREAVGNAIRHGQAGRVHIDLWGNGGARLRISDDGLGFDPDTVASAGGFGLAGIRERVSSLAGELEIVSTPGKGTVLEVRLP